MSNSLTGVAKKVQSWVMRHYFLTVAACGSVVITAWTLQRFFAYGANFDLVGQQLMAYQWLQGDLAGAIVGPTNHLLKMIFVYAPLEVMQVEPRVALVAATLLINIATYILLLYLIKKLAGELGVKVNGHFYAGMLWLAGVAGSVFWIQFANSRNLEVVGGVLLIYLGIRLLGCEAVRWWQWAGFAAYAGLLFFADPLQLYMTGVPVILYAGILHWRDAKRRLRVGVVAASLVVGAVLARALAVLASWLFGIEFLQSSSVFESIMVTLDEPLAATTGLVRANAQLLYGAYDLGPWRMLMNLGFVAVFIMFWLWSAWHKKIPVKFVWFVAVFVVLIELVYVASGQSLNDGTSRYLIMLAPVLVLVVASLPKNKLFSVAMAAVLTVNAVSLGAVTWQSWSPALFANPHAQDVRDYMAQKGYNYGYASMDTAIPHEYFYRDSLVLLPLACNPTMRPSDLFYGRAAADSHPVNDAGEVPIVLDGDAISNSPHICTEQSIIDQLGQPARTETTAGGSKVLIYSEQQLNF